MKNTKFNFLLKISLIIVFIFALSAVFLASSVSADSLWEKQIGMDTDTDQVGGAYGESADADMNDITDVRIVLAKIIRVFLGFMGIIFLILIIYGGFTWMTASGQEEKVNQAKKLLVAGIIGLIVVVSSFAIAELVTTKIYDATQDAVENGG